MYNDICIWFYVRFDFYRTAFLRWHQSNVDEVCELFPSLARFLGR